MRRPYLTDLTDAEWECIKGLLPTPENEGRPRLHSLRFTLREGLMGTGSSIFSFGGIMTKRTTEEIVDFGESKGVQVEREAKFKFVRP
jgi:hypothetical protein